mgnify:CR=1 FL=1
MLVVSLASACAAFIVNVASSPRLKSPVLVEVIAVVSESPASRLNVVFPNATSKSASAKDSRVIPVKSVLPVFVIVTVPLAVLERPV